MRRHTRLAVESAVIVPVVLLGLAVAAVALLLISGVMHPLTAQACITRAGAPPAQAPPPTPAWWQWAIVVGCVAAFATGHATAHVRHRVEAAAARDPARARFGSRTVQSMILVFLAVGVLLCGYEVISVVPDRSTPDRWPLSYYVRCVNDVAPYPTLLATMVVSFLLGHWFFHPDRRAGEGRR